MPRAVPSRQVSKQLPDEGNQSFCYQQGIWKVPGPHPMRTWEPLFNKINGLNEFDPETAGVQKGFLNGATYVEPGYRRQDSAAPAWKCMLNCKGYCCWWRQEINLEIWDSNKYKQFFDSISSDALSELGNQVLGGSVKRLTGWKMGNLKYKSPVNPFNWWTCQYHTPVLLSETNGCSAEHSAIGIGVDQHWRWRSFRVHSGKLGPERPAYRISTRMQMQGQTFRKMSGYFTAKLRYLQRFWNRFNNICRWYNGRPGVSSPPVWWAEEVFFFVFNAALDMRMDQRH